MSEIDIEIGIDCAPMTPRPSSYLPGVIEETGIEMDPKKPDSAVFGAWTWSAKYDREKWKIMYRIIFDRLAKLYAQGAIRGAQVGPKVD